MLQNQKMEWLVLLRYPHSDPLLSHCKEVHKSIVSFGSEGLGERNVQTETLTF